MASSERGWSGFFVSEGVFGAEEVNEDNFRLWWTVCRKGNFLQLSLARRKVASGECSAKLPVDHGFSAGLFY